MRRPFAILLTVLVMGAGSAVRLDANNPVASIEWDQTSIDFGEVSQNVPITAEFRFTNPGMIPLLITEVKPSCGCTVADFPKQPIISGGEGIVKVTFDAKEEGYFAKTITVLSNTQGGTTNLYIKGVVK